MRILLTLITTVLFQVTMAQDIQGKITYRATSNLEEYLKSTNADSTLTDIQRKAKIEDAEASEPMNFQLLFKGGEALYGSEHDMETIRRLGLLMNQTGFLGGYQYTYYSNLETDEEFYQYFFTKEVLVTMEDVKWTLTNETKKIGNYNCYKAVADMGSKKTLGMTHVGPVIAWYTPDIPVSFGIQNFNGLPGLTLELIVNYNEGQIAFKAIEISLNGQEDIKIKRPKGKEVTEEKYSSMIEKLNNARNRS